MRDTSHHLPHMRPSSNKLILKANRAVRLFEQAVHEVLREGLSLDMTTCLTYWETYGGTHLDVSDLPENIRVIKVIDRSIANRLSNKGSLADLLGVTNLQYLAPATYHSTQAALGHDKGHVDVWFFKPVFGTAGKSMYCVSNEELSDQNLPKHYVIQEGLSGLELRDRKKFTSRIYILIWNKTAYLYKNGFILTHGVPFDEKSTDYRVQIDHQGYSDPQSAVKIEPLNTYEKYTVFFHLIQKLAHDMLPVLRCCLDGSDRNTYIILGIDIIFLNNQSIKLIEINTSPNFVHSDEVNKKVNIPLFKAAIRILFDEQGNEMERIA